jgi:hypothetical protein
MEDELIIIDGDKKERCGMSTYGMQIGRYYNEYRKRNKTD